MIIRHHIKCLTCDLSHTLRIQVGHEHQQKHVFLCMECEENITVELDCSNPPNVRIIYVENVKEGDSQGGVVNLSPEFPINEADLHRDFTFASLDYIAKITAEQEKKGIKPLVFSSQTELQAYLEKNNTLKENWSFLKKGWSLTNKNRADLAINYLTKYSSPGFTGPYNLDSILFDFCYSFLCARGNLFNDASKLTEGVFELNKSEFKSFRTFYDSNIKKENFRRYFDMISEYFKCFNDLSQTLIINQYGIELSDDFHATSNNFSKTKLFYGNAYEALTSNFITLACVNNIKNGRKYDEFANMTFNTYQTSNKANRHNPFKTEPALNEFAKCIDSKIRNASHHGWMKIINKGKIIEYRSGGNGAIRNISYMKYIMKCNEIMLSCCALLALELVINFEPERN